MAQYTWPPVSFSGNSNPSVGTNGDVIPTSSTLVAGSDGTDLRPIKVGTDGTQIVLLSGTSPITGSVTVASGTLGLVSSLASGTVTINGTPAIAVASGTLGLVSSLASGTVTIIGSPAISGTVAISAGTLSSLSSGTVTLTGTPSVAVASGTLGLISSLASGTVTIAGAPAISGTVAISAGTLSSLASGTVTISGTPNVGAIAKTPAAGTVSQAALTVGTAAVLLVASGTVVTAGRLSLVVTPDASSTAKFYIGSSGVTPTSSSRGPQIVGGQPISINNDASPYYICSDTAAQTVYVMETLP